MILPASDKLAHALVGAGLSAVVALILTLWYVPLPAAAWAAGLTVLVAALAREAYGWRRGTGWSWDDIWATLLGLVPSGAALAAGAIGGA